MMRIAYITTLYPSISHTFIRREIKALERQGFAVTRVSLRGWDKALVDPADKLERAATRYVIRDGALPLLLALLRMLLTRPARLIRALALLWHIGRRGDRPFLRHVIYLIEACRVCFWMRDESIGHLHAHFGTNAAEIAMMAHEMGGPPWSFTVHGPEEFDQAWSIALAEKVRRCKFVVAVSSFGRGQLYRIIEYRYWPKVQVVHCGLDSAFRDGPEILATWPRRLVCVGRLCAQKGQLLLVEAAASLERQGVVFDLVLAGDGEMRADIETLIARLHLHDRVRITGWISGRQIRDEILGARALVLPSFAEGLPVAIMEAMALRRPVISTLVAGIPELVRPGENGWLVPAGDADALAHVMKACLDTSATVLEQMGTAAESLVGVRHNVDLQAARLAELLRSDP